MTQLRKIHLAVVATASMATGCASLWPTPREPVLGVQASGETLSIQTKYHRASWVQKEKVGEAEYKNRNGQVIGSSSYYQDRVRTVHWRTWSPMQGDTQLDDEDFLRITDDQEALLRHQRYRRNGRTINWIGKGMVVGGLFSVASALFFPMRNATMRSWTGTGGLLLGSAGWYVARRGAARFDPGAHTISPGRAQQNMLRYNRRLRHDLQASGGPRLSLSVQF